MQDLDGSTAKHVIENPTGSSTRELQISSHQIQQIRSIYAILMGAAAHVKLPKKAGESRDEWFRPSAGQTGAPVEMSAAGRSAYHNMHASASTI
jgi:hypothetical protein